MSGRSIAVGTAVAVVLVGGAAFSLSRVNEPRTSAPSLGDRPVPKDDSSAITGFRVSGGALYDVTAQGEARPHTLDRLLGEKVPVAVYDWSARGEHSVVLLGVSEAESPHSPITLFALEGKDRRQIASGVVGASLSVDARFLTYTTSAYSVVVTDITGKKLAEFRDCVDSEWYGDQVILTHAVDGIGSDSSSDTELLLASWDGKRVSTLVPSTFNAYHPSAPSAIKSILFASGKTGVSSFYKVDPATRQITQITNVGHTSFGANSVPVPSKPGRWSPNGLRYAYEIRDGDISETWIVGLEPGSSRVVAHGRMPLWLDDDRIVVLTEGVRGEERVIELR